MTRAYVAGPMTGLPRFNFDAFEEACDLLRAHGFHVTSPHEMDLANGFDPERDGAAFDLNAALEEDIAAVAASDVVALLPGWEDSPGTMVEILIAEACGIPCVPLSDLLLKSVRA
jgi:nucleoside 2-deoxyribosyltransferase